MLYLCQNSLTRKAVWAMPVIAIVDDNDPFRHATASFIRSLGYAVLQFASAEAFLKSNRLDDTDCLISDVQMPGMNGIELQGKLIAQGYHFPIIFVTAFPEMKARAQALASGDADAEDVDESQHSTRCDSIGRAGTASDLYRRIP